MKRSELFKYKTGLYWFRLGEGAEAEWVVGRLLQSRLIESPDGKIVPHLAVHHLSGPIPKRHFNKKPETPAERESNPSRRVSGAVMP